jgi:type II secretory pathway predicted ATPase ExeA
MNTSYLAVHGLKWNPFSPDVPIEAVHTSPAMENFCWRVEHTLLREGGFSLITGSPGAGKSVTLRILAERLGAIPDVTVGAMAHPQSAINDFYREMGDLFQVPLKPHNRWCGFKALRERWMKHLETTRCMPVLLIDEAQEMNASVLAELRLLTSARFDSRSLLCVVLAGDERLIEKLRRDDLVPLASRVRVRLAIEPATPDELLTTLEHQLSAAGNSSLMTQALKDTLCEHAIGNRRLLNNFAHDLLAAAVRDNRPQLDEKLYFELFGKPVKRASRAAAR